MKKSPTLQDSFGRSRRSYLTPMLVLVMGLGALVAVLALPALERVIWPEAMHEKPH